jgi:hypothetical protein
LQNEGHSAKNWKHHAHLTPVKNQIKEIHVKNSFLKSRYRRKYQVVFVVAAEVDEKRRFLQLPTSTGSITAPANKAPHLYI